MSEETFGCAHLIGEVDVPEPRVGRIAGGVAAVCTMPRPGNRKLNEDAAALVPIGTDSAVLLVADGVGGQPGGRQASQLALRQVMAALKPSARGEQKVRTAILNGIEQANRMVMDLGSGAATTLAGAEITAARLRTYHVGDSAILQFGQRSRVKLQTIAHSPVGFALEAGLLNDHEALHHASRHIVSNVIGLDDMRIEVGGWHSLAVRDTVLVSSDGVLDNLQVGEIAELVRKGSILSAARALRDRVQQRMTEPVPGAPSKPDDMTFVLYRPMPHRGRN